MDETTFRLNDRSNAVTGDPALKPAAKKSTRRMLLIVIGAVVLVGVFAVLLLNRGGKSKPATVPGTDETVSKKGFPVTVSGGYITDVRPVGGSVCVLSGDALSFVKPNGKTYGTTVLSFVEPVVKTSNAYGLAYDRLSGRFALFTAKKLLLQSQSETKGQILTGCVASDGRFAIACSGENGAASLLTYYDQTGKVLFAWECANEHIVAVSISPDARRLFCAALGAENGVILTKLYLLDLYSTDVLFTYTLNDTAVIDCAFGEMGQVSALCNDRRVILDPETGELVSTYVYPAKILCYASEHDGAVIVTEKFGSLDLFEVRLLDNRNRVRYVYETNEQPVDVDLRRMQTALLTEHSVLQIDTAGHAKTVADAAGIELGVCFHDARIYHFTAGLLYRS